MIRRYKNAAFGITFLEKDAEGKNADKRLCLSAAAILWEMANSDGHLHHEELMEMIRALNHEFHLMDQESGDLLEITRILRAQRGDIEAFIQELNNRLDPKQRQHLFDLVEQIAEADGVRHNNEVEFATALRSKLRLPVVTDA